MGRDGGEGRRAAGRGLKARNCLWGSLWLTSDMLDGKRNWEEHTRQEHWI